MIRRKAKPVEKDVKATTIYNTLKKIARRQYTVEESSINNGAW